MSETPYAETEALLCLLEGWSEECERILNEMLPNELKTLADVSQALRDRALSVHRAKTLGLKPKGQRGLPKKLPEICMIPDCGCNGETHP